MSDTEIRALRPFNRTPQGDLCDVGDTFSVAETRADELVRLGLAERTGKAAPKPKNKIAPEPDNKGEVSQKTVTAAQSAERIKRVKLSGGQA